MFKVFASSTLFSRASAIKKMMALDKEVSNNGELPKAFVDILKSKKRVEVLKKSNAFSKGQNKQFLSIETTHDNNCKNLILALVMLGALRVNIICNL